MNRHKYFDKRMFEIGVTKQQLKEIKKGLAAYAGSHTSEAKAKAARENGKKGGRPRKGI